VLQRAEGGAELGFPEQQRRVGLRRAERGAAHLARVAVDWEERAVRRSRRILVGKGKDHAIRGVVDTEQHVADPEGYHLVEQRRVRQPVRLTPWGGI